MYLYLQKAITFDISIFVHLQLQFALGLQHRVEPIVLLRAAHALS